jgi:hypothetical protein
MPPGEFIPLHRGESEIILVRAADVGRWVAEGWCEAPLPPPAGEVSRTSFELDAGGQQGGEPYELNGK